MQPPPPKTFPAPHAGRGGRGAWKRRQPGCAAGVCARGCRPGEAAQLSRPQPPPPAPELHARPPGPLPALAIPLAAKAADDAAAAPPPPSLPSPRPYIIEELAEHPAFEYVADEIAASGNFALPWATKGGQKELYKAFKEKAAALVRMTCAAKCTRVAFDASLCREGPHPSPLHLQKARLDDEPCDTQAAATAAEAAVAAAAAVRVASRSSSPAPSDTGDETDYDNYDTTDSESDDEVGGWLGLALDALTIVPLGQEIRHARATADEPTALPRHCERSDPQADRGSPPPRVRARTSRRCAPPPCVVAGAAPRLL